MAAVVCLKQCNLTAAALARRAGWLRCCGDVHTEPGAVIAVRRGPGPGSGRERPPLGLDLDVRAVFPRVALPNQNPGRMRF